MVPLEDEDDKDQEGGKKAKKDTKRGGSIPDSNTFARPILSSSPLTLLRSVFDLLYTWMIIYR